MKTKIHTLVKHSSMAASCVAASIAHASTDYGPAIWNPPSGCTKYYSSGYGHSFAVIHDMEGYYLSSISLLRSCSSTVSVFYAVSGGHDVAAGQITQMVRESNYAWHVGCWNKYMFGTEHEGFYNNPVWFTDGMYNATIGLQKHLAEAYGIAK